MNSDTKVCGPCTPAYKHEGHGAAENVEPSENIIARTVANAPPNDALVHGRTRLCRSCDCETESIEICPACADTQREEWADGLGEQCRGRRVEDLPVSELDEMQRGRC